MIRYATLDGWIHQEALPFDIDSDSAFDTAVDQLLSELGDTVTLLGLGETLHGGEEILTLRNRLFQRLVEAHGFSAIAIESSFTRAPVINDYIAGRGPDAYDEVKDSGFSHNFGALEANRALIEWMRAYNAGPSHPVRLHFYGFDSPTEMYSTDSPRQALVFVLDYLTALDSASGSAYRARIEPLLGQDAAWENPAALMDPSQSIGLSEAATALRIETEELITDLRIRRPELVAQSDADRYQEAMQHALIAQQLLTYHAGLARESSDRVARLLGLRDAMMGDNLAYTVSRERNQGKVFVFAHNSHLARGTARMALGPEVFTWWPAGAHADVLLGPRYAVIGTAVGTSDANGIAQPEDGTLEARLTAAPGPARFIPTHRGEGLPATEIAALPQRYGSARNPTYMPLTAECFTSFDALAVLDSVTYTRGGPPLPEPGAYSG